MLLRYVYNNYIWLACEEIVSVALHTLLALVSNPSQHNTTHSKQHGNEMEYSGSFSVNANTCKLCMGPWDRAAHRPGLRAAPTVRPETQTIGEPSQPPAMDNERYSS